ncbi:MAG: hypothetical protein HN849_02640 [Victivallales bacterium]|nr:hypothetical protein [Victivallales bacterium]
MTEIEPILQMRVFMFMPRVAVTETGKLAEHVLNAFLRIVIVVERIDND